MRLLEFEIKQQHLTKKPGCNFSHIVAGSVGYLHAKFHFSDEWDGCKKAAVFYPGDSADESLSHPKEIDEDGTCEVPAEVLSGPIFSVKVVGAISSEYIINTDIYKVKQEVI